MEQGYWFRSTRFQVIRGEDRDTSPGIYGRQLAHWLRDGLVAMGYRDAQVQAEPWGWCILVTDDPVLLWVGCGGVLDEGEPEAPTGNGTIYMPADGMLWHCHAAADLPWTRRWWGRTAAEHARRSLDLAIRGMLITAPEVQLVDPPGLNS